MVPSHSEAATLAGTAFVSSWANMPFVPLNPTVALDAAFQPTRRSYVQTDDPEGMRAWMLADPGRDAKISESYVDLGRLASRF